MRLVLPWQRCAADDSFFVCGVAMVICVMAGMVLIVCTCKWLVGVVPALLMQKQAADMTRLTSP